MKREVRAFRMVRTDYNSGDGYASYSKSDGSGWTEGSKSSK